VGAHAAHPLDTQPEPVLAPRISVVLTTFNRAKQVEATIESILNQSFADFELIVCDDASTDGTNFVVAQYVKRDSRVIYDRSTHNCGMPRNLNRGLRRARGQYVANLHDGDIYRPDLLQKWSAALDRHPSAAFVFNQYRFRHADGTTTLSSEPLSELTVGAVLLERIFFRRWRFGSPVWGTVMARRSAYEQMGYFDERFGFVSDVAMWMTLADRWDVAYVAEPLIELPSREELPRLWDPGLRSILNTLETMFLEGINRHWRNDGLRRFYWHVRIRACAALMRLWHFVLWVRRRTRAWTT
jgi:glycosyltransferase involved in cell wall biosynthesis